MEHWALNGFSRPKFPNPFQSSYSNTVMSVPAIVHSLLPVYVRFRVTTAVITHHNQRKVGDEWAERLGRDTRHALKGALWRMLLNALSPMTCSVFLLLSWTTCPKMTLTPVTRTLPHLPRKCPVDLPTGQTRGNIFSIMILPSQIRPCLCQVEKSQTAHMPLTWKINDYKLSEHREHVYHITK